MGKYEDNREQADREIQQAHDEITKQMAAHDDAVERSEKLEKKMSAAYDAGDTEKEAKLVNEHQRVQMEIEEFAGELQNAHNDLARIVKFWGLGK